MWIFLIMLVISLCIIIPLAGGSNKFYSEQLNNYSLNGNIRVQIGNVTSGNIFILSNNKELFFANPLNKIFNYINIKDIIEIQLQIKYEYKGKARLVSLTPQTNIVGKEIGSVLTIITENNVYSVVAAKNEKNNAMRLKALLEKEMQKVNSDT